MQSAILLYFAAMVACACAQVWKRYPGDEGDDIFKLKIPGNFKWERNAGPGKLFGTLGSSDTTVFGKGGYKQDIFKDKRGHLEAQAYGSRVLGANGDSSVLGGKLDWSNANDNARAALDVHKEIGQGSGMTLTGEGVWKLDKNTRLVTGGNLEKNFGHDKPEFGVQAKIEHDF